MKSRFGPFLWGLIIAGCVIFSAVRLRSGTVVDTSLLSLLPASEGDPLLTESNSILSRRVSHLLAFLVGHSDPAEALEMNRQLNDELKQSGFVHSSLTELSSEQQKAFYDLYFPFRYQMLSPDDRSRLQKQSSSAYFTGRLAEALYSPASSFLATLIPKDPLLFFPDLVRSWMETATPHAASELGSGITFMDKDGTSYAFTAVELALDPFDSKDQDRMMNSITDLRERFAARWPGSHFAMSGVLPFATAERLRTEREMKMVSLGSLIGVLVLTAVIFASAQALLLAALPIAVGFAAAVAATILVFGNIHIITFAFGSSLIGVAIDYPLLYLASHRMAGKNWDPNESLRQIAPGLLLGAATTLMGYAALSLAPLPGLRQMALFSSVGLCAALITVLLWLPKALVRGSHFSKEPRILSLGKTFASILQKGWTRLTLRSGVFCLVGLLLFIGGGLKRLRFDDDIRRLQSPAAALAKEDAFVRSAVKGFGENRYILIRGENLEELLERQEMLQERLRSLQLSGTLSSIQSLAPFLPSTRLQQEDRQLLQRSFLPYIRRLKQDMSAVGLPPSITNHFFQDIQQPLVFFSLEKWLDSPASQMLRQLWIGDTAHGFASAVLVGGLSDPIVLQEALKGLAGVRFFDQIEEYSNLFRRYRHRSMGLILAAYIGVWALMIYRYGFKSGTLVTAPSVVGVLCTFALFGWRGVPLQLIHCLSALLVLSMGIDYTIYFAECARAKRPVGPTLLAVELCAFSALLSFGLLALCRTPVLSSIGLTVFTGMAVAFLLAPLPYIVEGRPL